MAKKRRAKAKEEPGLFDASGVDDQAGEPNGEDVFGTAATLSKPMQLLFDDVVDDVYDHHRESLRYMLGRPQVEAYLENLRSSTFYDLFRAFAAQFLIAPASSWSVRQIDRKKRHHCFTHGLLIHTIEVQQEAFHYFEHRQKLHSDGIGRTLLTTKDQIRDAVFLHDFGKINEYKPVECTNVWVYEQPTDGLPQIAFTQLALQDLGIPLDTKPAHVLKHGKIEHLSPAQSTTLRYQDKDQRPLIEETDLISALTYGDKESINETRAADRVWNGPELECSCGGALLLKVPFDTDQGAKPTYSCAFRKPKCSKPQFTSETISTEQPQFLEWLKANYPLLV